VADTKISALTAATAAASTHEFAVNESGVSKKLTMAQIAAYPGAGGKFNASTANQGAGFASDTYLTGSSIAIAAGSLITGSMYRCKFNVSKTAAGSATPILTLRIGTAGTTADTSRCAFTFPAQTAVADNGLFEVFATFRSVGSGTAAVLQGLATLVHSGQTTTPWGTVGLSVNTSPTVAVTSSGFDSTVAGSIIGLSVNGGTSAAWTVNLVQSELFNLV
jgi:hypothetical protein